MAEPLETSPPIEKNTNSHLITTIQPTTKLGGRGTPRRKARRPSNTNHAALIAARTLENKLKPFRTQFQLQDQQELCEITILYDDGRIDIQKQAHVYSTWPMTLHEIDSSETDIQTYHINDLDSTTLEYLFGNIDNLENEFNNQESITIAKPLNYYHDIQQSQSYSQPSRYYMNYVAYQQNPYGINSYENYSNNLRQVYGGVNTQSDDENQTESQPTKKRRRRRRKQPKTTTTEESTTEIPQQQEEEEEDDEVKIDESIEQTENENISTVKPKRKRRRIRKSKKSLPLSSEIDLTSSIADEQNNQNIISSSITPTQHAENREKQQLNSIKNGTHSNKKSIIIKDAMNMVKNDDEKKSEEEEEEKEIQRTRILPKADDITLTQLTRIPTVVVDDIDKTEDENEKIAHSDILNASLTTQINPSIIINNKPFNEDISHQEFNIQNQSSLNHIQVNIYILLSIE